MILFGGQKLVKEFISTRRKYLPHFFSMVPLHDFSVFSAVVAVEESFGPGKQK